MNLLYLSDELLRHIICSLDIADFVSINISCRHIFRLNLCHMLIGCGIEGLSTRYIESIVHNRRRYNVMDHARGALFCMYSYLVQIAIMIGDITKWDYYNMNQRDFVYLLIGNHSQLNYCGKSAPKSNERKILHLSKIGSEYHTDIMSSMILRAIL